MGVRSVAELVQIPRGPELRAHVRSSWTKRITRGRYRSALLRQMRNNRPGEFDNTITQICGDLFIKSTKNNVRHYLALTRREALKSLLEEFADCTFQALLCVEPEA